jgi:hypothetical protein
MWSGPQLLELWHNDGSCSEQNLREFVFRCLFFYDSEIPKTIVVRAVRIWHSHIQLELIDYHCTTKN